MQNNSGNFTMEDAMRLAQSPDGQQLLSLLRQSQAPELRQAMDKASAGDLSGAQTALSSLLTDPQILALLKKMGGA